ncbi:MAG: hypothetical protein AAF206_26060 [Bacteroidota bacterium]
MEGIELIKDREGNITEIRVDVQGHPELAMDVYHLISALKRSKQQESAAKGKSYAASLAEQGPMSHNAFNQMIRDAKDSGEITESEFFQLHPSWQKKERLSLPS